MCPRASGAAEFTVENDREVVTSIIESRVGSLAAFDEALAQQLSHSTAWARQSRFEPFRLHSPRV
jgi:hypothetical protein